MKRQPTWSLYFAAIPLWLWLATPLIGQDCRIAGHIMDADQNSVPTAVVIATQADSGATHQVLSNAEGFFQLLSLPCGKYRIETVEPGFQPLSRGGLGLNPGSTATVDLQLAPAENSKIATWGARGADASSLRMFESEAFALVLDVAAITTFLP
jgi:hypothetical protein